MEFDIWIGGKNVATVSGLEATVEAWKKAVAFSDCVGLVADLVDHQTGEVIETNSEEEEEELPSIDDTIALLTWLGL